MAVQLLNERRRVIGKLLHWQVQVAEKENRPELVHRASLGRSGVEHGKGEAYGSEMKEKMYHIIRHILGGAEVGEGE